MAMNRRRESELRLEALGRLSDYYSDVANINKRPNSEAIDTDDQSQWEAISDTSQASTSAVVFDKPPPPGFYIRGGRTSDSARSGLPRERSGTRHPVEGRVAPMDPSLLKKPYAVHSDPNPAQAFNTSQLRPAKNLYRTQQAVASNPRGLPDALGEHAGGAAPMIYELPGDTGPGGDLRMRSHYSPVLQPSHALPAMAGGNEPAPRRPSYNSERPQIPSYTHKPATGHPVTAYAPYRPQPAGPGPGLRIRTRRSVSFSAVGTPGTYHGGNRRGYEGPSSNHHAAQQPPNSTSQQGNPVVSAQNPQSSGLSRVDNQPPARPQAYNPTSRTTTRVDGVDFELLSPVSPVSHPNSSPISPTPWSGPQSPITPTHAHPRPQKPAYGAWESDHPRQKRASFFERAQERLDRSVQEQLTRVGQRPPPSFKVNSVVRSSEGTCQDAVKRLSLNRSRDSTTQTETSYRDASTQTVYAFPPRDWELSSESEDDVAAALWLLHPGIPAGVAELEAPVPAEGQENSSGDDSLFLGRGAGIRHPASYSFFSSEYAQRMAAAQTLMQQRQRQRRPVTDPAWRSMPFAMSSASLASERREQ